MGKHGFKKKFGRNGKKLNPQRQNTSKKDLTKEIKEDTVVATDSKPVAKTHTARHLGLVKNYDCHKVTEVVPNLFLGSYRQVKEMVLDKEVEVLVPLNDLDGSVWNYGFRGEILYYPIQDFGVLPDDVMDRLVGDVMKRIEEGKKVGMFCLGGHGRTGYAAACVLGALDYADPIRYLRDNYCGSAVESSSQVEHIADRLESPWFVDEYAPLEVEYGYAYGMGAYLGTGGFFNSYGGYGRPASLKDWETDPFYYR